MSDKVCAKCRIELRPKKNGIYAVAMASFGPAEIYMADLWHCSDCGAEAILGFGAKPIASHFESDFDPILSRVSKNHPELLFPFWCNATERDSASVLAEAQP